MFFALLGLCRLRALCALRDAAEDAPTRLSGQNDGARLGDLLNAHPLFLFFFDRLSVELERELVYLERDRHMRVPYHKRCLTIFPSERLKLLTYRVEQLEQS